MYDLQSDGESKEPPDTESSMDSLEKNWFSEINVKLWPGQCFSLKVTKIIHEERSKYQDIKIVETETYGKCLILDNIIQCTLRDEFSYQEMITFLPLCSHPRPCRVLIIGGGDGGVAREVLKHPLVESVDQVEIDERVVELSKQYLPEMASSFDNKKVNLIIADGFEYLQSLEKKYDVIITDSSDPIGPAEKLYTSKYFELISKALRRGGIMCSQGSSYWLDAKHIKDIMTNCRKHFSKARYGVTSIPSYPCGHIGFMLASNDDCHDLTVPIKVFTSSELDAMNIRYYCNRIHEAAFALPRWVEKILNDQY